MTRHADCTQHAVFPFIAFWKRQTATLSLSKLMAAGKHAKALILEEGQQQQ